MKIRITKIDTINGDGSITLEECGLKIVMCWKLTGISVTDLIVLLLRVTVGLSKLVTISA